MVFVVFDVVLVVMAHSGAFEHVVIYCSAFEAIVVWCNIVHHIVSCMIYYAVYALVHSHFYCTIFFVEPFMRQPA